MKRRPILLFFVVMFILTGCSKQEATETTLQENQYYLVAVDEKKQLITLPEDFTTSEEDEEISVLKSYYKSNSTELFTLHYFKESDDYSVDDIEEEFSEYANQYEDLVSLNDGEIVSETETTEFTAGEMDGKYVEVTYSLDNSISYCAEFYVKQDSHILHGTLRLDGDDAEKVTIKDLAEALFEA